MGSDADVKVTLKTISGALNLSKTTVSLVLKGEGNKYRISKETQQRVIDYADSVNFEPNLLASALVTKKTMSIGLVFPDVHEAFMSEVVKGIESVLYTAGYSILLSTSGFNTEYELRNIRQLMRRKVDGMIVVPYMPVGRKHFESKSLEMLMKAECPVVFIDRLPETDSDTNWIVQNDRDSAYNAVRLLYDKGCRKIGYLSFDLHLSSIKERRRGYEDALSDCGLQKKEDMIFILETQDEKSGDLVNLVNRISDSDDRPDGLLVTTGGLAHKFKYLMEKLKPELKDLKIAKFGKDPDYFRSGMIQIVQPNTEMGRVAADTVCKLIRNGSASPVQIKVKTKILDTEEEI